MNKSSPKLKGLNDPHKITIKSEIIKMVLAALLFLLFNLALIAIPLKNENYYWIPAVGCAGIEVIFLLSASFLSERLERASDYYIFVTIIYLIALIGSLEIDIWFFVVILKSHALLFILLGLISLVFGFVMQFKGVRDKLNKSRDYNIASGRLNEKTGEWNLAAVLRMDAPQVENEKLRTWKVLSRWIYPFLPAVGMALDRNLGSQSQNIVLGIFAYFFTLVLSWGVAQNLAIALFILERERVLGKRIRLVAKHE